MGVHRRWVYLGATLLAAAIVALFAESEEQADHPDGHSVGSPMAPVAAQGTMRGPPPGLGGGVTALAVSAKRIAAGSADGRVVLFDSGSRRIVSGWVAHGGPIHRVRSVEGGWLTAAADGTIARWDETGALLKRHTLGVDAVNDVAEGAGAASQVLGFAATPSVVGGVSSAGEQWRRAGDHGRAAFVVEWRAGAWWTGGADGALRQWDVAGEPVSTTPAHRGWLTALATIDDARFTTAGADRDVILWDPEPTRLTGHSARVVALAATDRYILSGSDDGTARIWRLPAGEPGTVIDVGAPVLAVAILGDTVFTGDRSPRIWVWNAVDGTSRGTMP
jgi:WD40 repeat protein